MRSVFSILLFASVAFGQTQVNFTYAVGDSIPDVEQYSITTNFAPLTLTLSTSGQTWMHASLSSVITPSILTISVAPAGLTPGVYGGVVTVSSNNSINFIVTLTVSPALFPPSQTTNQSLRFTATQNGTPPSPQVLNLTASSPGASIFLDNSTPLPNWLTTPNFIGVGSSPANISFLANQSGLAIGAYTSQLKLFSIGSNFPASSDTWIITISLSVTAQSGYLTASTQSLAFSSVQGATPETQYLRLGDAIPGVPVSASMNLPAWLKFSSWTGTGTAPMQIPVAISTVGLLPGNYFTSVTFTTVNNGSVTINVSLTITPDLRPVITSVVNGASFKQGVGPGSWITIMGNNFGNSIKSVAAPFQTSLNGISAQLNGFGGVYSLLMYYTSPTQVNAFVPLEIAPSLFGSACNIEITASNGTTSFPTICQPLTPALFSYGTQHYASATQIDGTVVGVIPGTVPAKSGSIITLWGTGFGQTVPPTTTSNINYSGTGGVLAAPVVVSVGYAQAKVLYAGMVGVGLYQFNIQLPDEMVSGDYALTIQVNGLTTEQVVLPVR